MAYVKSIHFFAISILLIICKGIKAQQDCLLLQGIDVWYEPIVVNIKDIDRGEVYQNVATSAVTEITNIFHEGPNNIYFSGSISSSIFSLSTTSIFEEYEEYETAQSISIQVQYKCTNGLVGSQLFTINIQDTNNNSPQFRPADIFEFTIPTPLLPGYVIGACDSIVVRDIDLTTKRIDFGLTGSEDFEIIYDEVSSTEPKEFKAILRTTTFIRTLPESTELIISATDVDETGDPPRTSYATVLIYSHNDVTWPEEPVFTEAFYPARYTRENELILEKVISLQQGYHEEVEFSLEEEYSKYFSLIRDGNKVSFEVISPLSNEILTQRQIYIIVRAHREFTSGASATVIVQLPEEIGLQFEQIYYEGFIIDNTLQIAHLILTQGYENHIVTLDVSNDNFQATIDENRITLTMTPLADNVLNENTFLNLQVTASTERSSATAVVTLEIIKDDTTTPLFEKALYEGTYDPSASDLTIEPIELVQGYDDSVDITLNGVYANYFQLQRDGPVSILTVESLPAEVLAEQSVSLVITATKPRTIGATAVVQIILPTDINLEFERAFYEGVVVDNTLLITELILTKGYEGHVVSVDVSDEYFTVTIQENRITLNMAPLPDSVIEENTFLNLQVTAFTERSSATAVVTLEIIKDDTTTPLFEKALYEGTYDPSVSDLTIEPIELVQGYDDSVDITLDGVNANYFQLQRDGPVSILTVESLPAEVLAEQSISLVITATKPRTIGATAVVQIILPPARLLTFEAPTYKGTYENGILKHDTIILNVGYDDDVIFKIISDFDSSFEVTNNGNEVTILSLEALPDNVISENNFISIILSASAINAETTTTALLIEIIKDDVTAPVFNEHIYYAAYSDNGIDLKNIHLSQGYDSTVSFDLTGVHSQYFSLTQLENNVAISLTNPIPTEVIFSEKRLIFNIVAEKPSTVGANAAITVTFPAELTDPTVMKFLRNSYIGSIEDDQLSLEDISLIKDHTEDTEYSVSGELSSYFSLLESDSIITVILNGPIPEESIPANRIVVLEIYATAENALPAVATIILEVVSDDESIPTQLVFAETYYVGSYTIDTGLELQNSISLSEGYDEDVEFDLEGDDSQYFAISRDENSITLNVINTIPPAVLENNNQLLFVIRAQKPGSTTARASVIILLPDEFKDGNLLGFEQNNYVGSIEHSTIDLVPIKLAGEYFAEVSFAIHGELSSYFSLLESDSIITVILNGPIPEESIPANRIVVLEIYATAENALPAVATIILEVVSDDESIPTQLVFAETYYVGSYTIDTGLELQNSISLSEGYDEDVEFDLKGDDSQYFAISRDGNSITLNVINTIPPAVLENNNQLLFVIRAQKPGSTTARASVIILLPDEFKDGNLLGFEQTNYVGSIEHSTIDLVPIKLAGEYFAEVSFTIHGELSSYFSLLESDSIITVILNGPIPEESIPTNRIVVLEIYATAENALPAVATIILEVVSDDESIPTQLVFAETYYVGSYTIDTGLELQNSISLSEGYDEDVEFDLEGDDSQYFAISRDENSITLNVINTIPPAVLENNNQLLFVIRAQKPGSTTARASVIILLPDELSSYFSLLESDSIITVILNGPIPEESIPANRIVVLEIYATAENALPAVATIILEVVSDDESIPTQLVFAETYYVGSYTIDTGLELQNSISLSEGYDADVEFDLEGDDSQYFAISRDENSITLNVINTIPPAVLENNNQLLFVIRAQKPGSTTARASVIILLPDEFKDGNLLGFEQNNYVGSIEHSTIDLVPIKLAGEYFAEVSFTIHGELSSYFSLLESDSIITVILNGPIPEESIPANRIVVLEIYATAENALPAVATIILEVVSDDESIPTQLVFAETYYVGSYTIDTGLELQNSISLSEGYDEDVEFDLEGDDSQYFAISRDENSITLNVINTIPPAVLENNNQLLFVIRAQKPGSTTARASVIILLPDEFKDGNLLGFEQNNYVGSIEHSTIDLVPIKLAGEYFAEVSFTIHGELSSYFSLLESDSIITVILNGPIPEESIPANRIVVLEIYATAENALPAVATIILEVVSDDESIPTQLVFAETYYVGSYTIDTGLELQNSISLSEGYDADVEFDLEGDDSQYFAISRDGNSITLNVINSIPPAVLENNNQLLFVIRAQKPGSTTARASVIILLPDEFKDGNLLGFEQNNYVGSIEHSTIDLVPIKLAGEYFAEVSFTIHGELSSYFSLLENDSIITVILNGPIPEESIPANRIVVLEIYATAENALPAVATIILEVVSDDESIPTQLVFAETYYVGSYTIDTGLELQNSISLSEGYDEDVEFDLEGDDSQYFAISRDENSITLNVINTIPPAVLENNNQLLFVIRAQKPGSTTARASVIILLPDEFKDGNLLGFEQNNYVGSIEHSTIDLVPIKLAGEYFAEVSFTIHGELSSYFSLLENDSIITVILNGPIPEESIPANRIVVLEIYATVESALPAVATIILEVVSNDESIPTQLVFAETYYVGSYTIDTGLELQNSISLSEGYDEDVEFDLKGDDSQYFAISRDGNSITLNVINTIPPAVLENNNQLLFVIRAQKPGSTTARASVIILLSEDSDLKQNASFSKVIYEGILQGSDVRHETITLSNYNGTDIEILGEYSAIFAAELSNGLVVIQTMNSAALPTNTAYIILELQAGSAGSGLVLEVQEETHIPPSVTFSSPSYILRVEISQNGFIGNVLATADNGETVQYSLQNVNEHLQTRLTINNNGELHLSSPANSGVYSFQVIATTLFTQATGTASVYLTVESAVICGDDIVVSPLIVLDKDEEEEHKNLVVLNSTEFVGCHYTLTNRWPVDQNWLYVDETGLHAHVIDREHESIAFMPLSQVQVELLLECEGDISHVKTSMDAGMKSDWLGPYDYGSSNWILAETILYNSRRSFVNLIVNDINDNDPIFIGKENEPIAVGYPIAELEEIILPRALAELQATDADIGQNAALMYWSTAPEIAVSPWSGVVHAAAPLSANLTLTVSATDRRGQGNTGSIQLIVKMLDVENIAIVTVQDAFLEDEQVILSNLSSALGYDVKVLRTGVVVEDPQDEINEEAMRKKREAINIGVSLQLYVYGLIQREPVDVDRLTEDIANSSITSISITSTKRLEDYLKDRETCAGPGRDIGLLAATIVLSILLFILIVTIAIWFILKWRKGRNYEQFNDEDSAVSRNDSLSQLPKPENRPQPRINIEDLKRSERRLQEMIDASYVEPVKHASTNENIPVDTIIDIPSPDPIAAIVVQDKLKDADPDHEEDVFGEHKPQRRKSIVTFNENVQKIIHVDESPENNSDSDVDVHKL
ncbi:uncharacterized protein LOC113511850 isoform X2 [Galleria mellonella]|uniref:Uncharacterized protein LOC113511850 isoform X2 n=1 Tax=Galleria mellonella TaxID=7137 RepID=A0ABM3MNR6_GALME|nr:uncharacterized protein LOC113511850 isoform X2 [Galleria mellonella]